MAQSGFVARSLQRFVHLMAQALESERLSQSDGLLQRLDPRVKVIGLPSLVVAAALSRSLFVIAAIFAMALLLAIASRIPLRTMAARVWIGVLIFTGAIAVPAIFLTPGRVVTQVPLLGWQVTATGLRSAAFLLSRAETAATLAVLLIVSTPWMHVLKALRVLRVPVVVVVVLGMTYRYIFLLLETAREMFESRESRTVGALDGRERRRIATATAGVLVGKTFQLSNDVYLAMQSRGFTGEVYVLSDFAMCGRDYLAVVFFLGLTACALWLGR